VSVENITLPDATPIEAASATPTDQILQGLLGRISDSAISAKHAKVLLFGPSGTGKTVLGAGGPKSLVIDVEKGAVSLKNHYAPGVVKVLEYKSFYQVEELVRYLNENHPAFADIETLVVDSGSELHKRGLAEITERKWRAEGANMGNQQRRYTAETEDHTENNEHIRRLTSALRDLNRNLVFIAHHRVVMNKDNTVRAVIPDFSDKLANTLAGIFDVVGFLSVQEKDGVAKRYLRVRTDGVIAAKTRLDALPTIIEEPTFDVIYDAVLKQKD
jgi:phage nucleotide-binding protein